jgi:hexosaminidase
MDKQFRRLDYLGVNYSKGSVQPEITTVRDSLNHRNLVSLSSENRGYDIHYTIDGSEPTALSTRYAAPFEMTSTGIVKAVLVKDGEVKGKSNERKILVNLASGKPVTLLMPYSQNYPASGQHAMTDGLTGTMALKSGWQGYKSTDMEVVIDLVKPATASNISATFLQDIASWILYPLNVDYLISLDGINWQPVGSIHTDPLPSKGKADRDFSVSFNPAPARFIKVKAKNNAVLPEWHEYKGEHCWIFVDEIIVN